MNSNTPNSNGSPPQTLAELYQWYPPRPIRDEQQLDHATTIANKLAILDHPTRDQEDYLLILTDIIDRYEDEHYPIGPPED